MNSRIAYIEGASPSLEATRKVLAGFDYKFFETKLNIVGWRDRNGDVDRFDDLLTVSFKSGGVWEHVSYPITTIPGKTWLEKAFTEKGTAVLKPGQYIDTYKLGIHKGKEALVQRLPLPVYRDNDNNGKVDCYPEFLAWGMFGINIHRAGKYSHLIGGWSAGCQVFPIESDFEHFLQLCKRSGQELFTYTLVECEYGL